ELEQELVALEKEIEAQRVILTEKQRESISLERDIAILDAKIQSAELSIKARALSIKHLATDIANKEKTISGLSAKIVREKDSLAQLLRNTNRLDSFSLAEVILSNKNLSEFFRDFESFAAIKVSLQNSFQKLEANKKATRNEQVVLTGKQQEQEELKYLQELQKKSIEADKAKKRAILAATKGVEALYQKVVQEKEQDAAAIRSELFALQGSSAIPFEKALDYANKAFEKTGVRPALILGVIAEESNLGENVGTGNWRTDMNPDRDAPIFVEITRRLGLNPDAMPVSKKPWYGWGGAMGPAQFIPSTWVLYEDRIAAVAGHSPPNPWEPYDAFIAAALLMKDNGADKGTYSAERLAALRYFAGWKNATKAAYAFYGDEVMALAEKYQRQIDILEKNF
ncbi:MAG: hypothetical protein HYY60_01250, partial [Parcubacteria group bacterium]|nr:hypothetical protein [Parcubacteria group bacterium]